VAVVLLALIVVFLLWRGPIPNHSAMPLPS
jgi:hypothetical protein